MWGSEKQNASEIGKIWERLLPLEKLTDKQKKTIDEQASEIKNLKDKTKSAPETKEEILGILRSVRAHKGQIIKIKSEINEEADEIKETKSTTADLLSQVISSNANVQSIDDSRL